MDWVLCLDCNWEGMEDELKVDEYDLYNESNQVPCQCPICGSENISG